MSEGNDATPDLSLPAQAPSMAPYLEEPMSLYPAALYTLFDLTDEELGDLERECERASVEMGSDPRSSVRLAPQPRFAGQPLRAVYDYHLEHIALGRPMEQKQAAETQEGTEDPPSWSSSGFFDRWYFVVAVEREWRTKGVLLVALTDDDLQCKVDSFRMEAFEVGLIVCGLQIGNSSWEEQKEGYELHPPDDDNEDGDGQTEKAPACGRWPIYIHSSLSEDQVVNDLEPLIWLKEHKNYACRVLAKLTPAPSTVASTSTSTSTSGPASFAAQTQDLIQQAVALHPQSCAQQKFLFKMHILLVDTADPVENGMLMVKLPPWDSDGDVSRSQTDALDQVGKELDEATPTISPSPSPSPQQGNEQKQQQQQQQQPEAIRIPYDCQYGLQTRYLPIAHGEVEWPSASVRAQPVYLVFQYNTGEPGYDHKGLGFGIDLMDPRAGWREAGEERFLCMDDLGGREPGLDFAERSRRNYDKAVRLFPWSCRESRFVEGLETRFFVCVDGDEVARTGVLLVRRDWDGNVWGGRTRKELLGLPIEGVKSVRVPIKEALATLEKGGKGETEGMSESLRDFFS